MAMYAQLHIAKNPLVSGSVYSSVHSCMDMLTPASEVDWRRQERWRRKTMGDLNGKQCGEERDMGSCNREDIGEEKRYPHIQFHFLCHPLPITFVFPFSLPHPKVKLLLICNVFTISLNIHSHVTIYTRECTELEKIFIKGGNVIISNKRYDDFYTKWKPVENGV